MANRLKKFSDKKKKKMRRKRAKSLPEKLRISNADYFNSVLNWSDDYGSESESESYYSSDEDWISSFLKRTQNKWLCRVPDSFLLDNFNLYGLSKLFPRYERCIEIIRDIKPITDEEMLETEQPTVDSISQGIYFLIHARYMQTDDGMRAMREKYLNSVFGKCPRIECHGQNVIATGVSDTLGVSECCVYCPRCKDVFHSYDQNTTKIDSAAFGVSFGPLFFRTFPDLACVEEASMPSQTIYGFKVNKSKLRAVHPINQ